MYKTIEEIRKSTSLNQTDFATKIGTSFRTYQSRLKGNQPNWLLNEIILASQFNEGRIKVSTTIGDYMIDITKI